MERKITAGRDPSNDIHVSESYDGVSRTHANIYYSNGRISFEDISTNGSYVNNNFIHRSKIEIFPNDVVMLGKQYVLPWSTINNALSLPSQRPTEPKGQAFGAPYPGSQTPPPASGFSDSYTSGRSLDRELNAWNWGAFFFGWLWGIFNGVYWPLVALIPYVGWAAALIINIVLGIKGNAWAWKGRYWKDFSHFRRVQKSWAMWALYVFIASVVLCITSLTLFFSVIKALIENYG
ncbi:MAG: FHA domain-containing protein [Tannerella sp.]|jgi:hypothetical protein|nr:FHA domain-containing protein [Tannerella sp.]